LRSCRPGGSALGRVVSTPLGIEHKAAPVILSDNKSNRFTHFRVFYTVDGYKTWLSSKKDERMR